MKRLIYLVYLGLLLFILIACEKETVMPAEPAQTADFVRVNKSPTCQTYSYSTKTGTVNVGTVSPTQIIVGFNPNLTLAQRQAIMRQYRPFDSFLPGDFDSATGDLLTFIKLKTNVSCAEVEALRTSLENRSDVNLVLLTYQAPDGTLMQYFNGVVVKVKNNQGLAQLQQFALATNTQLVDSFDNQTYLLRVDKNSTSSIFGIISSLNSYNKIEFAEPDSPLILALQ